MKKVVKLNQRELHRMISESTKRILNELSVDKINRARLKSNALMGTNNDYNDGYKQELLQCINTLTEFFDDWGYDAKNSQASDFSTELYNMEQFINKKFKQANNFQDYFDDMTDEYFDDNDLPEIYNIGKEGPEAFTDKFGNPR